MRRRLEFATAIILMMGMSSWAYAQLDRQAPKFTPKIDGTITAAEMAGQLEIPMAWPLDGGALVVGAEPSVEQLSAKWYVSWDDRAVNFSAVVLDDTPNFRLMSGGAYNAQDVIQPCFNPLNDPNHSFNPDPGGGPAAIYDMVVDTLDESGPDIYRHGAVFTTDGYEAVTIEGTKNENGYVLEASIPWKTAMDDVNPNYVPKIGDIHGLGLILLSFDESDQPTLFTDYGDGVNTIQDPTTWNKMTLVAARQVVSPGDFDGDGTLGLVDINTLNADIRAGSNTPKFDVTGDGKVTSDDLNRWVTTLKKSWYGDANLDGEFNSGDFVGVFSRGKYELNELAQWDEGDWNSDGRFNSADFVAAFSDGGYERGVRSAVSAVPEPSGVGFLLISLASVRGIARAKRRNESF